MGWNFHDGFLAWVRLCRHDPISLRCGVGAAGAHTSEKSPVRSWQLEVFMSELIIELGLIAMILIPAIATSLQPARVANSSSSRVPPKPRPTI
jgi:hypothetical protein